LLLVQSVCFLFQRTLGEQPETKSTEDFQQAAKILADAQTILGPEPAEGPKPLERKEDKNLKVAVFGYSKTVRTDPLWAVASKLGEELAARGYHIMSGGYGGTMEAVSEGASKVKGAIVEGVICPSVFPLRGQNGNKFLTVETKAASLAERITCFMARADVFIALPGTLGTLTELVMAWNLAVVHPMSGRPSPPVFAMRQPWQKLLQACKEGLGIPEEDLAKIGFFEGVQDLIDLLAAPSAPKS